MRKETLETIAKHMRKTNAKLAELEENLNMVRQGQGAYMEILKERLDKVEGWTKIKRIQIDKAKELFEQHQEIHALEKRLDKLEESLWKHKHQLGPKAEDTTSIPFVVAEEAKA